MSDLVDGEMTSLSQLRESDVDWKGLKKVRLRLFFALAACSPVVLGLIEGLILWTLYFAALQAKRDEPPAQRPVDRGREGYAGGGDHEYDRYQDRSRVELDVCEITSRWVLCVMFCTILCYVQR